jgi:ribose transport system substrate-binding protein
MGLKAPDIMIQLIKGETVADPLYTGLDTCNQEDPGFCKDN